MARWRTVVAMRADRAPFEGDAFSDALGDAFCDALRPHHPSRADRLQIAASSACEEVRQIGIFDISSSATARRSRRRCSPGPVCDPLCGPICEPSGTDHPFRMKSPQTRIFQRPEKTRQRVVLGSSRRARGVSCGTCSGSRMQPRCTSAGAEGAFLSWNGSGSPYSSQGVRRAAARPHTRSPWRRLRNSSTGRWSR